MFQVPENVWRINTDIPEETRSVSLDNTEERWWEQTELTKLILASNMLKGLGEGLTQLPALTVLDVSLIYFSVILSISTIFYVLLFLNFCYTVALALFCMLRYFSGFWFASLDLAKEK